MIRSTLFKNIAHALRDSLNDAEVSALGMWLLMSAGAYPSRIGTYNKDDANLEEMERAMGRHFYPDSVSADAALVGGSFHPDKRFVIANRGTVQQAIEYAHQIMYTIAESNEQDDEQPVADVAEEVLRAPPPPGVNWHALNERAERMREDMRNQVHWIPNNAFEVPVPPQPEPPRPEPAHPRFDPEQLAEQGRQIMRERIIRERQAEQQRIDALANRVRGIPNGR